MARLALTTAAAVAVVVASLTACAPRVPVPEVGDHEGVVPMPVPYPPPAARAEIVPPRPHDDGLWVDGYWMWRGGSYAWNAGRWVRPGPAMVYARASVVRLRSGELLYYPPRWHRRRAVD